MNRVFTVTRQWSALFALLGSAGAGCAQSEPREIRVGLLAVLEGPMGAASGEPSVQGARMAVNEINAGGGVEVAGERYRLRLIERAYENRPDAAASAARALINLDSADILVGPQISAHAISAGIVAEASEVPMISPMASNPMVTAGRKFVFRLAFLDAFQGELLARYAYDSLGLRRGGVLFDAANPYGREIARLFQRTFEARGGRMVSVETFVTDGGADFTPQLRRILATSPDALLLPNYSVQDSLQVKQARALGFRGRFLGSDTWDPVSFAKVRDAEGTVLVSQWSREITRPQARTFIARFTAAYHRPPRTTSVATYDAVVLLADAARRAGTIRNGAAWARAIGRTARFEGAGATYRFNGTGDPKRSGCIVTLGPRGDSLLLVVEPSPE